MILCQLFIIHFFFVFFFKQKTAYEMRISDWSSDVCSSDLQPQAAGCRIRVGIADHVDPAPDADNERRDPVLSDGQQGAMGVRRFALIGHVRADREVALADMLQHLVQLGDAGARSEEHTSELQSLMRISYAVFCLKKEN